MVLKIFVAAVVILIGSRMVGIAIYTFFTGKVLVRHKTKTKWVAAPSDTDFTTLLLRDGLMGVLLVILGVALIM
jgi:hypothetical protein